MSSEGYEPPSYKTCSDGVSARCPVEASLYGDYFTLGACIFFVVAHALALIPQIYFGIRARTWSYTVWLAIGTIFELIGYCGRIIMSSNPWVYNAFVIQLVLLILGPTLVAAAISITFKHLVLWYGREYSFIKPVLYPWVFVGTDFFSIIIQAAGGGVSSAATNGDNADQKLLDVGSGMLVAGVVFQMANMVFCGGLMLIYMWRRHKAIKNGAAVREGDESSMSGGDVKVIRASDKKTKMFVCALAVAYVAIIIRCIYRIPEMQMGWGSTLMQNETTFLILDGAMILIAVWTLTIFHPYFFFPFLGKKGKVAADAEKTQTQANEGPVIGSA
ncbi:RTA1 like protein-domain-containing protein [Fusarium flagelliforme]|uniref:RTA1 like protein-domain-containing protein n=1 Tax=Fusarium flagelliforme TaxID=2675880 RepID=UPI001E8E222E|nr:RTA1 like protein-domain-containing protein [Fusarium flagelliforme]KAH7173351.1 RTA1 like protein-domain-containing protein [Fusarium flagelliforme]